MSYDLSKNEMTQTMALPAIERLGYFVKKVATSGLIWTLAEGESLLILGLEEHDQFVVVFPHPDFALEWFEESGIEEADLVAMDLEGWLEGTLDELGQSDITIAVFPTSGDEAAFLSASDLLSMLKAFSQQKK